MKRPTVCTLAATILALGVISCASRGFVPQTPSMPAARAALRPEYRIFYDAMQDYGDWVLIEPFGFVFRPRVDFATFRPYADGFWAPSDSWGWVWISAEPFGWATYHYGTWLWDRFQSWVWVPGVDWGPAWVSWQLAGGYAGWAPLGPRGGGLGGEIPGGAYLFAPLARMGSTDLRPHMATRADLGAKVDGAQPVEEVVERDGVRVNLGPAYKLVERALGAALPRVKIEDALGSTGAPGRRAEASADAAATPGSETTRQAGASAARQARRLIERGGRSPSLLPVPRPPAIEAVDEGPDGTKRPRGPARGGSAPDTTR